MPSLPIDPEPPAQYERLPGESAKAFAAFTLYRDMDPADRSLHAAYRRHNGYEAALRVAEQLGDTTARAHEVERVKRSYSARASGGWCDWYYKWGWKGRVEAFDQEQDRRTLARRVRGRRDLRDRKVNYGRLFVGRALPRLNEINPQDLTLADALQLVVLGLKLESEGMGDSLDVPEGASVAKAEESYIDRIHRLRAEREQASG